jgi:hypothetical protein
MIGEWKMVVDTPFGDENYNLKLDAITPYVSGGIWTEMGFATFDNGKLENGKLEINFNVDTPQKSSISIEGNFLYNIIMGTVQIDEYPKMIFKADPYNVNI